MNKQIIKKAEENNLVCDIEPWIFDENGEVYYIKK